MPAIWMNAWDLDGRSPAALAAELRGWGLDACRLGLAYHGGRMLLPRHPRRTVYEQDLSGLFVPTDPAVFDGLRLRPHVPPEAALVPPFVEACTDAGVDVYAWTVLLHNDRLGAGAPGCCIRNVFGERYPYGLCPAHPDVRAYAVALCRHLAAQPGLAGLDLEALGYMGYAHGGLHDKRGIPLPAWAVWLLSVCTCDHCRHGIGEGAMDAFAAEAEAALARYFETLEDDGPEALEEALDEVLGAELLGVLVRGRQRIVRALLDEIRAATAPGPINLRLAPSPLFCGGKAPLGWGDLAGRADAATLTFFGYDIDRMAAELRRVPAPAARPLPVHGGCIFHGPDCRSEADVAERLALLADAELDGYSFYSYGMAATKQLGWLADGLRRLDESPLATADAPAPSTDHR